MANKPVKPTRAVAAPSKPQRVPRRDAENVVRGVERKTSRAAAQDAKRIEAMATATLGETAEENMLEYGTHTIEERAISCLNDGLKPVQRRNVYGLFKMNLFPSASFRKSAKVVGEVMGDYHPHGDSSIYGAMVRMSNGNGYCAPLVDGQGNWGDYEGQQPTYGAAAMRYTECRMTSLAANALVAKPYMDEDVIPYIPNYDENTREPIYLPALIPLLFANGSQGIATGVSCSMPPYSMESVIDAVETLIKTKGNGKRAAAKLKLTSRWGAVPQATQDVINEYHATGVGKVVWKVPHVLRETKTGAVISVSALPIGPTQSYPTWKENLEAINGVYRVDNFSADGNIHIEIECRGDKADDAIDKVLKKLTVSETYRAMTTLRDRHPDNPKKTKVTFLATSPIDMLERWYHYRIKLEQRLIDSLLRDNAAETKRLNLMIHAATNLDKLVVIIKAKSGDKVAMIERALKVNREDAQTIWRMTVSQLDALNVSTLKAKLAALAADTRLLKSQRADPTQRIGDALKKVAASGVLLPQFKNASDESKKGKSARKRQIEAEDDE